MITYLDQLRALAEKRGVDLKAACVAEGIASTTLMRWENGSAHPSEAKAKALWDRILMMPGANRRRRRAKGVKP